jgi:polyribonucleotide nucleotidyltransferase
MFDVKKVSIEWGGETLTLETGKVARQADGAVIATLRRDGRPVRRDRREVGEGRAGFLPADRPLSGKIFGSRQASRAASSSANAVASEKETLVSRLIDRPIRPLFPEGFYNETQRHRPGSEL